MVPMDALVTKGQLTGVYTVDPNNVITYRLVRLGKQYNGRVEILAGLKPGEIIISENVAAIVDGSLLQTEK